MPEVNPRQFNPELFNSSERFFHGTTSKLEPGDVLQPGGQVGIARHSPPDTDDNSRVFLTKDEGDAWAFADSASRMSLHSSGDRETRERPHVYEVEPYGEAESQTHTMLPNDKNKREYTAGLARVVGRRDVPAPNKKLLGGRQSFGAGVQPTFPGDDPNFAHGYRHPEDEERATMIEQGVINQELGLLPRARGPNRVAAMEGEDQPALFSGKNYYEPDWSKRRRTI